MAENDRHTATSQGQGLNGAFPAKYGGRKGGEVPTHTKKLRMSHGNPTQKFKAVDIEIVFGNQ